jgi:hypothetical protein
MTPQEIGCPCILDFIVCFLRIAPFFANASKFCGPDVAKCPTEGRDARQWRNDHHNWLGVAGYACGSSLEDARYRIHVQGKHGKFVSNRTGPPFDHGSTVQDQQAWLQ